MTTAVADIATAGEIMTAPVACVTPETSIWSAWSLMTIRGVRHLLVSDHSRCVGVVDDRTMFAQWPRGPGALRGERIDSVMRTHFTCVLPDASIADVARAMLRDGTDAIPVVTRDGSVIGIITGSDLLAAVAGVAVPD